MIAALAGCGNDVNAPAGRATTLGSVHDEAHGHAQCSPAFVVRIARVRRARRTATDREIRYSMTS